MVEEFMEEGDSDFVEDSISIASSTFGVFIAGALAVVIGIFYVNSVWGFMEISFGVFDWFEIILGAVLLAFGGLALRSGQTTEGILMAAFGIYALFFGISFGSSIMTGGYPEGIHFMGLMMGICMLVASGILMTTGDVLFGIAAFLLALSLSINIFDFDTPWAVSGLMTVAAGVIFIYCAIGNWIYFETGKDLLPIV